LLRRLRKAAILLAKLAVTAGLVWWVLSAVSWHDYVTDRAGRHVRVLDHRDGQVLVEAPAGPGAASKPAPAQWRPMSDFRSADGQVVRPGMAAVLGRLRVGWFVLAAAILACQLTLMGVRWWYLMRHEALGVGLWTTIRLMYVGHFFNFFLPGATGGDVIRAYLVTRRTTGRAVAVATVLLDRFIGLAGMGILAGVMALVTWSSPQTHQAAGAIIVILAIIVAAGLVMFSRRVRRGVGLDRLIARLPRAESFRLAVDTLHRLPRSPRAAGVVAAMTLGVHVLLAGAVACLGQALELPTPVAHYFLFVPVIYILAALPVSIGGLGLVEGMYVLFFAAGAAADNSALLALALLARLTPMLLSLPGLVFWLGEKGEVSRKTRRTTAEDGDEDVAAS